MLAALAIAAVSIVPLLAEPHDVVEVIEKNSFLSCIDNNGKPQWFHQWVFWEIRNGRERVVAWQMAKPHEVAERTSQNTWRLRCRDNLSNATRVIEATSYRQTWTTFDVELCDRERHPVEKRRGLSRGPTRPAIDSNEP